MTIKYICNKCKSEKNVKRVMIKVESYDSLFGNDILFDEDLCDSCGKKLKTIANKFLNNDEIVFVR